MTRVTDDGLVRLWWIADGQVELQSWREELAGVGRVVEVNPADAGRLHVVVELPESVARERYDETEESFLELEEPV